MGVNEGGNRGSFSVVLCRALVAESAERVLRFAIWWRYECQPTDDADTNVRTAAIFACKDGGIGVDPVLRLRRPVTRFGVGTILDGTGTGGGLEIVESG